MDGIGMLLASVFVASLLGSLHCAGMCGGLVAFYAGVARERRHACHAAYSGGRLISYAALGAVAGAIGASVDLAGSAAGVQGVAGLLAGGLMLAWGMVALFPGRLAAWLHRIAPRWLQRLASAGVVRLARIPPLPRAFGLGLLSTLLPCGWLYAFAVVAAGTAQPLAGALVMSVFWAGTVPVLLGLGYGVQALAAPLRARLPALTAAALVGIGLITVLGRVDVIGAVPAAGLDRLGVRGQAPAATLEHVKELEAHELPCCRNH